MKTQSSLIFALIMSISSLFAQVESERLCDKKLSLDNVKIEVRLELQKTKLDDILAQSENEYKTIRNNIITTSSLYKDLNSKLINLKSRLTKDDYKSLVHSIGSMNNDKLGYSFNEVLIEIIKKNSLIKGKSKLNKVIKIVNALCDSPTLSSFPVVSEALLVSNSLINLFHTNSLSKRKTDFTKIREFENDLNKYISFYSRFDEANNLMNSSIDKTLPILESLQKKLITLAKTEAQKLNIKIPEKTHNEKFDDYYNRIFSENFTLDAVNIYLDGIEKKYTTSDDIKVDYSSLLSNEKELILFNNNIEKLTNIAAKYFYECDRYFTISTESQNILINSLEIAKSNGIFQEKYQNGKLESPEEVYENLIIEMQLKFKKQKDHIKSSLENTSIEKLLNELIIFTSI